MKVEVAFKPWFYSGDAQIKVTIEGERVAVEQLLPIVRSTVATWPEILDNTTKNTKKGEINKDDGGWIEVAVDFLRV